MISNDSMQEQKRFEQFKKEYITVDNRLLVLQELLYISAMRYPNNIALIYQDLKLSYKQLHFWSQQFTNKIVAMGIKPHDRVLLFFENSAEFYCAYFAIVQSGAVVVPLNTFLRERELDHIIHDSKARLLIAAKELLRRIQEDKITNLPPILTEDDFPLLELDPSYTPKLPIAVLQPDDMAALLYTSGTTGLPKGVMLSSRNIMINVIQTISRLGYTSQERVTAILPLFHVFAQSICVWATLLVGSTVIIAPRIERRYIIETLTHKPTVFLGVPSLFGLICLLRTLNFDSVKYCVSGGDALPDRIRGAFELIYQRKLACGYGLSESSPVLCADLDDEAAVTSRVGKPLPGVTISIRDEEGNDLPQERMGRIWVQGENVMLGYYNEPEKTQETIQDGWLDTGDLGYIEMSGKLVVTGRLKDLIKSKGFNIYPQEIENVILMHPNVVRVGVIGEPDQQSIEIAVAYVQIRQEQPDIELALKELCKQHLASYKIPKKFICQTSNLPTTATGKVDKKKLRTSPK